MGLLSRLRGSRPPASAVSLLDRDERVTAWGRVSADEVLVATPLGLWLPGCSERLGWHEIHTARWDSGVLTLIVGVEVSEGVREDLPPERLALSEPQGLPAEVRARVTRSVAYSSHHPLRGGGVRIVARRIPGRDGLSWAVRYDPGTTQDVETARRVEELVAAAQESMSPPPDLL
jgi:hypothetical protein